MSDIGTMTKAEHTVASLIAHARGWVLDVDGCIVRTARAGGAGGEPMPGAVELVRWLKSEGKSVLVCTNASQKPVADYAEHLRQIGFDIADKQMITAATAAAAHIAAAHGQGPVVAVGDEGLMDALDRAGVRRHVMPGETPVAVVVAAADTYQSSEINAACLAIADHGAAFYVSVDTPWFHGGRGRSVSSSTAIARAISGITGVTPQVCGKPSPVLADVLKARLGVPAREIVIVGDMATIEVRMARQMGGLGVLVLSGGTSADQLTSLEAIDQPHLVAADTQDLLDTLKKHL